MVPSKEEGGFDNAPKEEDLTFIIAAVIRSHSEGGRLATEEELLKLAADRQGVPPTAADPSEEVGTILRRTVEAHKDLCVLLSEDGSRRHYSSQYMTEAYARLLLAKEGDQMKLMAEVIRENSALYPRPIPLEAFTSPPFDLTLEQITGYLDRMAGNDIYLDIASTATSTSRVFLYSTRHLEPDYAAMLAEWLDVGQSDNP
jgi:hypothetical protein